MAKPMEMRTKKERGMDAVLERTKEFGKTPKKRPILRKKGKNTPMPPGKGAAKGPGMTVMIAVGTPKKSPKTPLMPQPGERPKSKDDIIARLEARIAQLEAKLADDEGEMEEEGEEEGYEDEDEED
jgi:hypothetical protein